MSKNKNLFLFFCIFLLIFLLNFIFANSVFASPSITSFLLNGSSQNVTFNPKNSEKVSIGIITSEPVKFNTIAICLVSDSVCSRTTAVKYFTQTNDFFNILPYDSTKPKEWDGKTNGDNPTVVEEGEYRIKATIKNESDVEDIEFGQHSIFVDFSNQNNSTTTSDSKSNDSNLNVSTTTSTSDASNQNNQTTKVITRTVYISAHSGTENLSDYNQKTTFDISAGRERMAPVGSPIEFNAKYTLMQNNQCMPNFKWSLGDGFEVGGKSVTHIYKYPGEYQVVLNGTCGDQNSISRTTVQIISPNISISNLSNGDVEIINNGKTEINIGNWKIKGGQKDFVFPQDTIISAGQEIILSKEDLNNISSSEKLLLNNPSGKTVAIVGTQSFKNLATSSGIAINQNVSQAAVVKNNSNISAIVAEPLQKEYKKISILSTQKELDIDKGKNTDNSGNENIAEVASVLDSVNLPSKKSFWSKIISVPANGIKSFLHMFYDF